MASFVIRMKFYKNKFLTTGAAVALALAVGACSSSSDDDEMVGTPPPATDDEMAGTPPATDDEMAGTPPATDDEMAGTPPATTDPVELADSAYDEYLDALTAYEVAQGVYALTPTAANLTALREAVDKVVTEASEALVLAGAGTAAQLVRAQNAVAATVTDSSDVVAIEEAVEAAADRVTALADAATAATTYDSAKAAYEATGGMTQANLDALSDAATAAKATADAALVMAAGGSAAQLSEAQNAVAAADAAATHAIGITTALEAGIAATLTAYDTAKTAHTAAKTAHDDDASLDNANALKTAADDLLAAAMKADDLGALGASEEQRTELESVSVTDAEAYVATAGDDVTTAQTAADAAAVVAATEAAKLAAAADTEAAATKVTAITKEAAQGAVAGRGLGGSAESAEEVYMLTIERDRTGTTVEIADPANVGEDDPKFALAMDLGGGRTMHTRKMEADEDGNVVEEVVIVSTDIAGPKAVAFAKFEDDEGMPTQALDVSTDTTNDPEVGDATFEALAVDQTESNVFALVKSSAFTANSVATLTFPDNDPGTTTVDDAFETAGTYNGAMGTYRCNGDADCTVTLDAMGAITGMSDGWIFTPDSRVTSDQPDYDYLHYGFWLEKTTDEDGVLTYDEVETFAGSSAGASGTVANVDGSATYDGGSTGVYVKNVYTEGGSIESATSGHFKADVSLTAIFGQVTVSGTDDRGTIAPSLLNTLTGTIDNFDLSGGEVNEWAVNLKGDIIADDGTASGTANGGGAEGAFSAIFHGPLEVTPATDDDAEFTAAPGSVVGEFGATFSNGSVAGGFGARK